MTSPLVRSFALAAITCAWGASAMAQIQVAPVVQPAVQTTAAPAVAVSSAAVKAAMPTASQIAAAKATALAIAKLCDTCGTVQELRQEKRKGSGGALGLIGGAVAGGLVGNQVGGGDGKKVATVAGAAGGALLGNELQKRLNRKTIHITSVKMKDGTVRVYESETAPVWAVGDTLRLEGAGFVKN